MTSILVPNPEIQHKIVFEPVEAVRAQLSELSQAYPEVPYYNTYSSELALWKG